MATMMSGGWTLALQRGAEETQFANQEKIRLWDDLKRRLHLAGTYREVGTSRVYKGNKIKLLVVGYGISIP